MSKYLKCPKCGARIPLNQAIAKQFADEIRSATSRQFDRRLEAERVRLTKESRDRERNDRKTIREKDKQLADTRAKISVLEGQVLGLKRKAEQGSQQIQGEVAEMALQEILCEHFPLDEIEPMPTGSRGADFVQRVRDRSRATCGTIIWEVKETKSWSQGWLAKLRSDQRDAKADVAVLVTAALPRGERDFCLRDGVWVVREHLALCLATALRAGVERVHAARTAVTGRNDKADQAYTYLTGQEFRANVQAILECFGSMKHDLDAEKRTLQAAWTKRETYLRQAFESTASLYLRIQAIAGRTALPELDQLTLELLPTASLPVQLRLKS